jgi:hypothetical protein
MSSLSSSFSWSQFRADEATVPEYEKDELSWYGSLVPSPSIHDGSLTVSSSSPMIPSMSASFSWSDVRGNECSALITISVSVQLVNTLPTIMVTSPSSSCSVAPSEHDELSCDHLSPGVCKTREEVRTATDNYSADGLTTTMVGLTSMYANSPSVAIIEDEDEDDGFAGTLDAPGSLAAVLAAAIEAEHTSERAEEDAPFGTIGCLCRLRAQEGRPDLFHAMDAIHATLPTPSTPGSTLTLATSTVASSALIPTSVSYGKIPDETATVSTASSISISYEAIPDELGMESTLVPSASSATEMYEKLKKAIDVGVDVDALLVSLVVKSDSLIV